MRYALADVMIYVCHNRRAHHNVGTCLWYVSLQSAMFQRITQHAKGMSLRYGVIVLIQLDTTSFQEIILSSGFFRRETASGFYPWGNVEGPRKRVADGLCGWRHENSFPMTKAHSRTAKCEAFHVASRLFFMFLFLITLTIRQQSIIIAPLIFL